MNFGCYVGHSNLRRWVMGEDSGLVVDALDGAPGVFSARFSGPAATDESNNALLLEKLGKTPLERRFDQVSRATTQSPAFAAAD